ncbi:MAG: hypothetical protein ACMUHX_02475 [bacterium]
MLDYGRKIAEGDPEAIFFGGASEKHIHFSSFFFFVRERLLYQSVTNTTSPQFITLNLIEELCFWPRFYIVIILLSEKTCQKFPPLVEITFG